MPLLHPPVLVCAFKLGRYLVVVLLRLLVFIHSLLVFAEIAYAASIPMPTGKISLYTQGLNLTGKTPSIGKIACAAVLRSPGTANILKVTFGRSSDIGAENMVETSIKMDDGTFSMDFGAAAKVDAAPIGQPYPVFRRLFDEAMGEWRDYSVDQHQYLREMDDQLAINRVHWIQFHFRPEDVPMVDLAKDSQGIASLRLFDGSQPRTKVMGMTMDFSKGEGGDPSNLKEALTPIELSPPNLQAGYLLPFRQPGKVVPTFIMHIGVATNVRKFHGGVFILMSHAAKLLDIHYNNSMMKTFRSLSAIEKLNMVVVTSAKPALADVYKKFGFEDWGDGYTRQAANVYAVDSAGNATLQKGPRPTLPDGMVLLVMKAEKFMERFHDYSDVPHIKMETEDGIYTFGDADLKPGTSPTDVWVPRNQEVLQSVTPINDLATFENRFANLARLNFIMVRAAQKLIAGKPQPLALDRPEAEFFAGDPQYDAVAKAYRDTFEEFYRIVAGLAPHLRTREWTNVEITAINLLTDGPLEGLSELAINPANGKYEYLEALENVLIK